MPPSNFLPALLFQWNELEQRGVGPADDAREDAEEEGAEAPPAEGGREAKRRSGCW